MSRERGISAVIFTEGGRDIGFGHLSRCLALSQALERAGISAGFVIRGDQTVRGMFRNKRYVLRDWISGDPKKYAPKADIVVIDSYLASGAHYRALARKAAVCVYIDDNDRISYPAGIIVNSSLGAEGIIREKKKGRRYLLGPEYVPLRSAFRKNSHKLIHKTISNIVITFGGDDLRKLTPVILESLCLSFPKVTKTVLIGKGFSDIAAILRKRDKRTRTVYYPDAARVRKELLAADLAVTAGGQTLYECACLGTAVVSVCVAANQENNIKAFRNKGVIFDAGSWDDRGLTAKVLRGISSLRSKSARQKMHDIGRALVDGKGAQRIAAACQEEYFARNLVLRSPRAGDIKKVFSLSNDPAVRKSSFEQHQISWHDHLNWFKNILKEKQCFFLLAESAGEFAGQIRFRTKKNEAQISISIVRKFRRKRAGSAVLRRAIDLLTKNDSRISSVKAFIRRDNPVSVAFFKRAGFSRLRKTRVKNQKAFELSYDIPRTNKK